MKIAVFLLIISFVCSSALEAQPQSVEKIKARKDYHLKGDVKQVIKSFENYKKEIVSEKLVFTPQGYLQYEGWVDSPQCITYMYDKAGRLLKYKRVVDADNFMVKTYTYNAQGLLIKYATDTEKHEPYYETYQYASNGVIQQRIMGKPFCEYQNTYDTQKRIIRIEEFFPRSKRPARTTLITYLSNGWAKHVITSDLGKTTSEYDNKGRIRSHVQCNLQNGEIYHSIANSYDGNDNLIESQCNDIQTNYTYNEQGEQISKEVIRPDGDNSKTVYIYIKHDAKGNWTERIVSNLTTYKRYTETRDITYYEKVNTRTATNDSIEAFFGKGNFKFLDNGDFVTSVPNTVAVGEQFRLDYTIGIDNVDNLKAPSFNDFTVLTGPSRSKSTSTEVINGVLTSKSSITYRFVLQAEKEGSFTIPEAIVESGGKTYTSNAVTIKVTSN